jgi:hypothetical protein
MLESNIFWRFLLVVKNCVRVVKKHYRYLVNLRLFVYFLYPSVMIYYKEVFNVDFLNG